MITKSDLTEIERTSVEKGLEILCSEEENGLNSPRNRSIPFVGKIETSEGILSKKKIPFYCDDKGEISFKDAENRSIKPYEGYVVLAFDLKKSLSGIYLLAIPRNSNATIQRVLTAVVEQYNKERDFPYGFSYTNY